MMPMSALGAIVIYTGYKLCRPKVWKHVAAIGGEQLFVFATTVLVTVSTDLLWGIAAGIAAKLVLEAAIVAGVERERPEDRESAGVALRNRIKRTGELFRNPVVQTGMVGDEYHVCFGRPVVCFNALHLNAALAKIPATSSSVCFHVTSLVTLLDHTATETLLDFVENFQRTGRGIARIVGLEELREYSRVESCMRISAPILAPERARALSELTRMSLTQISAEGLDPAAYLARISLTRVEPITGEDNHVIADALTSAYRSVARRAGSAVAFVRTLGIGDRVEVETSSGRDLEWFSLYRVERGDFADDVERLSLAPARFDEPLTAPQNAWPTDVRNMGGADSSQ
jgi:hypothetical protein